MWQVTVSEEDNRQINPVSYICKESLKQKLSAVTKKAKNLTDATARAVFYKKLEAKAIALERRVNFFRKARPNPKPKPTCSSTNPAKRAANQQQRYTFAKPTWTEAKQAVFSSSTDSTDTTDSDMNSDMNNTSIINSKWAANMSTANLWNAVASNRTPTIGAGTSNKGFPLPQPTTNNNKNKESESNTSVMWATALPQHMFPTPSPNKSSSSPTDDNEPSIDSSNNHSFSHSWTTPPPPTCHTPTIKLSSQQDLNLNNNLHDDLHDNNDNIIFKPPAILGHHRQTHRQPKNIWHSLLLPFSTTTITHYSLLQLFFLFFTETQS